MFCTIRVFYTIRVWYIPYAYGMYHTRMVQFCMAVAIDTNLLVALRAIDLLLTPTPSRDHMLLYCPVSILER